MSDVKWEYQERAFELAESMYGIDFYDLSSEKQQDVYAKAMYDIIDRKVDYAEFLCEARKYENVQLK